VRRRETGCGNRKPVMIGSMWDMDLPVVGANDLQRWSTARSPPRGHVHADGPGCLLSGIPRVQQTKGVRNIGRLAMFSAASFQTQREVGRRSCSAGVYHHCGHGLNIIGLPGRAGNSPRRAISSFTRGHYASSTKEGRTSAPRDRPIAEKDSTTCHWFARSSSNLAGATLGNQKPARFAERNGAGRHGLGTSRSRREESAGPEGASFVGVRLRFRGPRRRDRGSSGAGPWRITWDGFVGATGLREVRDSRGRRKKFRGFGWKLPPRSFWGKAANGLRRGAREG